LEGSNRVDFYLCWCKSDVKQTMAEPDTSQMSGSKKRKQSREQSYIDSSNVITEKRRHKKATTMNTGYLTLKIVIL
jgi:hypothetical protein